MRSVVLRGLALSVLMLSMGITSGAQQAPAAVTSVTSSRVVIY